MKTELLRRARQHFVHDMVPKHTARYNMRNWIRAIRMLGDKWQMARTLGRPS